LAAVQTSPSGKVAKNEQVVRLAGALVQLPEKQRQAIELYHLQGLPLVEVGRRLDRSPAALAGLLHRGLKNLKQLLDTVDEAKP
jgi:RNA polymerase sigma-70 factor (ECF subfamily)